MIKSFLRNTIHLLIGILWTLILPSCIYEAEDYSEADRTEGVRLVLNVKAIGARAAQSDDVVEMIKSVRIIIIDEEGNLEANDRVTPQLDDYKASSFIYSFFKVVSPGNKKLYLVANEESVKNVGLTDLSGLPTGLPLNSLTSLLDYFKSDSESANEGSNLEKVLNRVYFNTDYNGMKEGNFIYLPYSSYYDITVGDEPYTEIEKPLHLVPAAVKFDFTLINYREATARIEDIAICSLNSHTFLNAQLADSEKRRILDDDSNVWWVDWLHACAVASQTAEGSEAFNYLWGWITDYSLPVPGERLLEKSLNTAHDEWIIDGLVDKNNPSKLSIGPFYVAESIQPRVLTDDEKNSNPPIELISGEQAYALKFMAHDDGVDEITTISGIVLNNLKALFRATHVMVTVELYESEVQVYAEPMPWAKKLFLGYVQEDDDF